MHLFHALKKDKFEPRHRNRDHKSQTEMFVGERSKSILQIVILSKRGRNLRSNPRTRSEGTKMTTEKDPRGGGTFASTQTVGKRSSQSRKLKDGTD